MTGQQNDGNHENDDTREVLGGEGAAVREAADLGARATVGVVELPQARTVGVVLQPGQSLIEFDLDDYTPVPFRKTGTVGFSDADSLVEYVNRHKYEATTLWANAEAGTVTAVLNDHAGPPDAVDEHSLPGHGDHRAVLRLDPTPDWRHWIGKDGKFMGQHDFAEHLEDGAGCVIEPDAATMLEIAQTFIATNGVEFKSSNRLDSGETQFRYEETVAASAGRVGDLRIPATITLGLAPFDGSPTYELAARFRYRISSGGLSLAYRLIRPDLVLRESFDDVTTVIAEGTQLVVLAGTPRST